MNLEELSLLNAIITVLWIMGPAYIANSVAVLTGGKYPIDQGRTLSDGNRISKQNKKKMIIERAESEMLHDKKKGIDILKTIMKNDSEDEYTLSVAFNIGYYYDQETVIDSALKYYTWIKDNHPNSDQAIHATQRLYSINLALSSIESDTIESISGE